MPATPLGLCFGGANKRTLFVVTKNGLYSLPLATQGETINGPPTIAGTTRSITNPLPTDTEIVTSNVTDDAYVASAELSYTIGGTGLPTQEFSETFASTPTANGSAGPARAPTTPGPSPTPPATTMSPRLPRPTTAPGMPAGCRSRGATAA